MTDPVLPTPPERGRVSPDGTKPPPLGLGMGLLGLAAVLIVVVLVQPTMPGWLKTTIGILALLVVAALLIFAVRLWMSTQRAGRRK